MQPQRFTQPNMETLAWEYLQGHITPLRAQLLSEMLAHKDQARQRFIEASVMHGMLFEYFKNEHSHFSYTADGGRMRHASDRSSPA